MCSSDLAAIEEASLTGEERIRLRELEEIIERIQNQVTELSMRESLTNDSIYEATLRNIIYELQIYQQEYEALLKNKDEYNFMKRNLETLIKHLEEMDNFEVFEEDIFKDIIERGILNENYKIDFIFKCGIKRTAYGWKRGILPAEPLSDLSSDIDY